MSTVPEEQGEHEEHAERGALGAEAVADAEWARVRTLAATVARLEEQQVEHGLDEAGQARLERTRLRVARAAERALLADGLADRLAEMRSSTSSDAG